MPSENAQGQPYCQQMWCTTLSKSEEPPRLASTWLLGTDGHTWQPCCDFCLGRWVSLTAAGSLSTAPMYAPEPAAATAPAAPAAAAAAPQGVLARYRAWKAANRTRADLAEVGAIWAGAAVAHHYLSESTRRGNEKSYNSLMGIAPRNNAQAGMWRQEERAEQARVRHQQDEMAADLHAIASQQGSGAGAPASLRLQQEARGHRGYW